MSNTGCLPSGFELAGLFFLSAIESTVMDSLYIHRIPWCVSLKSGKCHIKSSTFNAHPSLMAIRRYSLQIHQNASTTIKSGTLGLILSEYANLYLHIRTDPQK